MPLRRRQAGMRQMPDSLLPQQHEGKNQGCDEIFRAQDDLLPSDPGVPALDRVQRKDVRNAILPGIANGTAPGAAHPQGTLSGCRNAGDAGAAACIGVPNPNRPVSRGIRALAMPLSRDETPFTSSRRAQPIHPLFVPPPVTPALSSERRCLTATSLCVRCRMGRLQSTRYRTPLPSRIFRM